MKVFFNNRNIDGGNDYIARLSAFEHIVPITDFDLYEAYIQNWLSELIDSASFDERAKIDDFLPYFSTVLDDADETAIKLMECDEMRSFLTEVSINFGDVTEEEMIEQFEELKQEEVLQRTQISTSKSQKELRQINQEMTLARFLELLRSYTEQDDDITLIEA